VSAARPSRDRGRDRLYRYRFQTRWQLAAAPDAAYAVLEDVVHYGDWWAQVREAQQLSPTAADLRIRSVLPYDLRIRLDQHTRDATRRLLVADLSGDIEGLAGWTITEESSAGAGGPRCVVQFDEDVMARSPLLRRLAPLARPAFIANHAVMMRDGERGLARRLGARA